MADEKHEYYGVYTAESDGYPVALFDNADLAQQYRKNNYAGDTEAMVLPADGLGQSQTAVDAFKPAEAEEPEEGSTADPHANLRAEIRAELEAKELRERLTKEVESEMAEEKKPSQPAAASTSSTAATPPPPAPTTRSR